MPWFDIWRYALEASLAFVIGLTVCQFLDTKYYSPSGRYGKQLMELGFSEELVKRDGFTAALIVGLFIGFTFFALEESVFEHRAQIISAFQDYFLCGDFGGNPLSCVGS